MKVGVVIGSTELGNFVKNVNPTLLRTNVNIYIYIYIYICVYKDSTNASYEPLKL